MTLQEVKDYLNKEERKVNEDGSETITIRAEPWLNWFLRFAEEHETWCKLFLTEANFESVYNIYGNGWSDGFQYASKLPWK